MKPLVIIRKFYKPETRAYEILIRHSQRVTQKALETARRAAHLKPDLKFIEEAAMLHDIGVFKTHAPDIGCTGIEPYIRHGVLGREILEKEGFPKHALVCERHIGVGITSEDVKRNHLPLPERDMVPVSLEERIICFADKFFSKNPATIEKEKSLDEIIKLLEYHGKDQVKKFKALLELFQYIP